ncbi:MAG: DUF3015 family protein [Gammaproteobacteria bacterium]
MKKTLLAIALLTTPLAALAETGPGCGWGTQLFEGKSGLGPHILAGTTNGFLANQLFGMTSGTAGCDSSAPLTVAANDFLDQNMEKVARDMSAGQGESVLTLANLMGISQQDQQQFVSLTQANFSQIFSRANVTSIDVMTAVNTMMKQDSTLAKYAS